MLATDAASFATHNFASCCQKKLQIITLLIRRNNLFGTKEAWPEFSFSHCFDDFFHKNMHSLQKALKGALTSEFSDCHRQRLAISILPYQPKLSLCLSRN